MIYKLKRLSHLKNFATRKDWLCTAWIDLLIYMHELPVEEIDVLLRHILTDYERQLITRRAVAVDRFSTGTNYKSVGEETWLSKQALYAIKKGLKSTHYLSDWEKVKVRIAQRKEETLRFKERPEPVAYRRTKYGRMRTW